MCDTGSAFDAFFRMPLTFSGNLDVGFNNIKLLFGYLLASFDPVLQGFFGVFLEETESLSMVLTKLVFEFCHFLNLPQVLWVALVEFKRRVTWKTSHPLRPDAARK